MYRRTRKYQQNITRKAEKRLSIELRSATVAQAGVRQEFPEVRRVIER